ncbi:hypothetical protein KEM52_006083 [Ascosphaera acerosa]|nr:hypothetical protein KEM52_006083 [Ascosphaera acerosa]
MPDVKRQFVLVTEQSIKIPAKDENTPAIRDWSIEVFQLTDKGQKVPATLFDSVTYKLHPSFGDRTVQKKKEPPFRIDEEGWGEFDMQVVVRVENKDYPFLHDLNFGAERYEQKHTITFKNPKASLLARLADSGPVPGDDAKSLKKRASAVQQEDQEAAPTPVKKQKKAKAEKNIDLDKLADGLQRLGEDDLLTVVQLVNEHKTPESYTKNDPEQGEFHIDLYTLPDNLIKMLWDLTQSKGAA